MSERRAQELDHKIIDGVSYAMDQTHHKLGDFDHKWLRYQIEHGKAEDKLRVAVEIAVAFLRYSQDLKTDKQHQSARIAELERENAELKAVHPEAKYMADVLNVAQSQLINEVAGQCESLRARVAELETLLQTIATETTHGRPVDYLFPRMVEVLKKETK